jgi:hypothetical protein
MLDNRTLAGRYFLIHIFFPAVKVYLFLSINVAFNLKRTESEYNLRFGKFFESVRSENRQEVIERRLPGDDLYFPEEIITREKERSLLQPHLFVI